MCACVYVVAQRFHCLCVWVCHRFYSTDYFSPLPFAPPLPLSSPSLLSLPLPLSCYVCLFFYTDWCIFRSVLTRLEPCGFGFGFGFGPLLFGSHCGFLPLAHAKQKRGGHSQIEFCGTRATLSTKKV